MHVRVLERGDLATPPALTARPPSFAYQALRQPERQALLTNAARTLEQQGLWQPRNGDGASQAPFDPVMAKEGG
jgi:hypothetical protein